MCLKVTQINCTMPLDLLLLITFQSSFVNMTEANDSTLWRIGLLNGKVFLQSVFLPV